MNDNRTEKDKEVERNNSIVTRRTVTIFALFVFAFLLITQIESVKNVFNWVADILRPVFMGVIFAYIINPVYTCIEKRSLKLLSKSNRIALRKKERISRALAVLVSVLFLLAVIALLMFLIIPEFLESFAKLIDIAPSLIQKALNSIRSAVSDNTFGEHLGKSLETLAANLTGWIGGELSSLIAGLLESAISLVSFLINFLVSLVVCVYALLEKKRFVSQIKKILFAVLSCARANDVLDVARYGNAVFGKFITGKLITSSIVGIVTFLFMTIMSMPYALLSAGIIAITNVIPFFGPFIGGIPTAFIVLLTDVRQGLIYIIFLVVLQQLEGNIIEPLIMEDRTGVSKFWITVALLFCGGVFGLVGMIFSVPLFAVLFYCIKIAVERSLSKKSLPLPSSDYWKVSAIDPETHELYSIPEKKKKRTIREHFAELRSRKQSKNNNNEENNIH